MFSADRIWFSDYSNKAEETLAAPDAHKVDMGHSVLKRFKLKFYFSSVFYPQYCRYDPFVSDYSG